MKVTKIFSVALASLLLVTCLLMGGCSTPEIALEYGDEQYTMGDYLAYIYSVMYSDQNVSYYTYYLGQDALKEKIEYQEEEVTLKEYILRSAQDSILREIATSTLLKEHELSWDAARLKEIEKELADLEPDAFLPLGFSNQRYIDLYKSLNLNEYSLFFGLYGKGGKREVAEADIRKHFDENFTSFKIVELSLVNKDESEKSEAEVKKIEARLQKYLDAFNATGKTGADFDKAVYTAFKKDEEATKATTTTTKATTTATGATTTVAATTTTVASTTVNTSASGTTTTTTAGSTDDKKEETTEKVETAERNDLFKDEFSDEELYKAVKEVEIGSAAIKTYKKNGSTKTMALIFRMDPEAERDTKDDKGNVTKVDYYKENQELVLENLKFEEYNKEIEDKMKEIEKDVIRNERALKAPDLKEMIAYMYGN